MELLKLLIDTTRNMAAKLATAISSAWGWFIGIPALTFSLIDDDAMLLTKIIWVTLSIDLCFGTWNAIKSKRHVLSQAIMVTVMKYAIYSALFWLVVLAEKGVDADWFIASRAAFAFCMAAEIWSVTGHVAIIYPKFIFVRVLRKALVGEVARKLNVTEEEALEILDGKRNEKGKESNSGT